ncbi:MAG: heme lyase CcmF/NrfE family subunit [Hyphomicrobiaceae bacterium]
MTAEIGHFALLLALAIALVQSIVPIWGAHRRDAAAMAFAGAAAMGQFVFVAIAFACLTYAFIVSDFSVAVVVANSHTAKPLLYKISGVWANHEGSMLLWLLILAVFGAAVALYGDTLPDTLRARVLGVQGMIGLGFLAFVVFTSNPFRRVWPPPFDGEGINPILQDPGLALHPPFLYLGYVGFSMAFSFSVAALLEGRVDACWARWVRPWVLAAWCFLTIGITLGSAWAYYTLGWGGWWFWDPVENASFMPWLVGTALLHSALVVERRNALMSWTILLGILTFSLSLVGTFLVRSGVLTSVHAFALDPERGVFILALIILATGGALTLYALRMPRLSSGSPFATISKESSLVLNNLILIVAAGTVFLGTFYPLLIDLLTTDKISVGPPYYNQTFVPIVLPLLVAMAIGPVLKWKRASLEEAWPRLKGALIASACAVLFILAFTSGRGLLTAFAMGVAAWLIFGSVALLLHRLRIGRAPIATSHQLARTTPRSFYGLVIAHAGVGIAIAGIAGMSSWASEQVLMMRPGQATMLAGYEFKLASVNTVPGPNYTADQAVFHISRNARPVSQIVSERRFFPVRQQQTTSAGINWGLVSNLYVSLGEPDKDGAWSVRLYHHPLVTWIWLGALAMSVGGFVSLFDRRLRVGAPQRARHRPVLAPAE